jgi:hypothetical protein
MRNLSEESSLGALKVTQLGVIFLELAHSALQLTCQVCLHLLCGTALLSVAKFFDASA